jgi:hypothetical protein
MQGLSALAGVSSVSVGASVDTDAVRDGVGASVGTDAVRDDVGASVGTEGAQADKLKEKTIAIFNSQTFFIFTS